MRTWVKRVVETGAVRTGLARRWIANDPSGVAILAYHNIAPHGEDPVGERSAHLAQETFSRHLDAVLETHDVVRLEDAMRATGGLPDRPQAVITFDDAYSGAVTVGFEELERRGLPATMFVPPGLLGCEGFWWDRVGTKPDGSLDYGFRRFAVEELQGRQDEILLWARSRNLPIREVPRFARPASAANLVHAATSANVTLAPHTWNHPNLAALSDVEAREEIERSRRWVAESGALASDWLAYPYGIEGRGSLRSMLGELDGSLMLFGGLARKMNRWQADRLAVPRIVVPRGLSPAGLKLRLAGWLK